MNRQTRIVFYGLIVLVALLAGSTSFFYAKSRPGSSKPKATDSGTTTSSSTAAPTPTAVSSSQVTKAASASEKPSHPSDTYTIQQGETLFAIAQKQGITLKELSDANGITDTDKIQAGQVLIVPKGGQVSFTIDNTKATELQNSLDSGKILWRENPEDTARSDSPGVYGLKVTDNFVLKDRDNNSGTATVTASQEGKNYLIKLSQPATKGEKGLWAIESIAPVAS